MRSSSSDECGIKNIYWVLLLLLIKIRGRTPVISARVDVGREKPLPRCVRLTLRT
jgi:hypothetical protein